MVLSKRLQGLWWNKSFRRWAIASFLLYQVTTDFVSAEPDLIPVFTYQEEGSCAWQANNALQILDKPPFYDLDGITTQYFYDPQTQALTAQSGLPYRFSMLTRTSPVFPRVGVIQYSDYTARTEVYPSPDGRYVVYSTNVFDSGHGTRASIALTNLETKKSTVLPTWTYANHFTIQWGFGSNAFVITEDGSYGSDPFITYVSGFESSLEELTIAEVTGYSELAERLKQELILYQVLDVDSTGRYLLGQGDILKTGFSPEKIYLLLIDTQDFTYEVIAQDRHFITARFEQPGDQRVYYFNLSGIFAYDRQIKTQETLNSDLQDIATWTLEYSRTCQPTISPDGRFIAFDDDDETNEVIVVPIKEP